MNSRLESSSSHCGASAPASSSTSGQTKPGSVYSEMKKEWIPSPISRSFSIEELKARAVFNVKHHTRKKNVPGLKPLKKLPDTSTDTKIDDEIDKLSGNEFTSDVMNKYNKMLPTQLKLTKGESENILHTSSIMEPGN